MNYILKKKNLTRPVNIKIYNVKQRKNRHEHSFIKIAKPLNFPGYGQCFKKSFKTLR